MVGNQAGARRRQIGMRRARLLSIAVVTTVLAAGCGIDDAGVRSDGAGSPTGQQDEAPLYEGAGTVLESPDHGPQLCGAVEQSLPPQCAGVSLVGWDWDAVEGEESLNGTTWGSWRVTGTWDGEALTLTETPSTPTEEAQEEPSDLSSPCPTPDGGWVPVDPSKVSVEAQDAAMRVADQLPDVAGTWFDHSINPALADGFDPGDEEAANDPTLRVVNVQVTDDTARAESAIREVWGGALCVSTAERTMAELRAIQDELRDLYGPGPGGLSSGGIYVGSNQVRVTAYVATPELLDDFERRFGDAVEVTGLLEPVTSASTESAAGEKSENGIDLSVTLWHCGVEPVTVDGRDWEVPYGEAVDGRPSSPLDSTNTPEGWVGSGTAVVGDDSLTYTDEGGEVVGFVPEDGQPPSPCG